jgi:hypothetical protein
VPGLLALEEEKMFVQLKIEDTSEGNWQRLFLNATMTAR